MLSLARGRLRQQPLTFKKATAATVLGLVVAVVAGLIVAGPVFHLLEGNPNSDIHNYVLLFDRYSAYLAENVNGFVAIILSELHFYYWYEELSYYVGDPTLALQILSFVGTALIFLAIQDGTMRKAALSVLLLSHPRALDLLGSQQRMAVALACILIGARLPWFVRYPLFALAMTFHTYAVVLVASLAFYDLAARLVAGRWRRVVMVVGTLAIVTGSVILQRAALSELGAVQRIGFAANAGVLYTVMWALTAMAMHVLSPKFITTTHGAMFYMLIASAVAATAVGLYGERYYAIAIVFLAASNYWPKAPRNIVFLAIYGVNLLLSLAYWL